MQVVYPFPDNYKRFCDFREESAEKESEDSSETNKELEQREKISFKYFEYSPYLSKVLSTQFSHIFKNTNQFNPVNCIDPFIFLEKTSSLSFRNLFIDSFSTLIHFSKELKDFESIKPNYYIDTEIKHAMIDQDSNMIAFSENSTFILNNDILICINHLENMFIILSEDINHISIKNHFTVQFKLEIKDEKSYLNARFFNSRQRILQTSRIIHNFVTHTTTHTFYFKNSSTNTQIVNHTLFDKNGNRANVYKKNNLKVQSIYHYKIDKYCLISECDIYSPSTPPPPSSSPPSSSPSDMEENKGKKDDKENELRYRGRYEEIVSQGKIVNKKLLKDDELIYNKENDQVLVDQLKRVKIKDEILIGWKVAKSIDGDERILKLMIPVDAKIVQPVDREFFSTRGKVRCSKAIVMDIQLPLKNGEVSCVPREMSAYSYVYEKDSERPFVYHIGKEVIPDRFDESEDLSCTNGIHFYHDRDIVFEQFLQHLNGSNSSSSTNYHL